MSTLKHRYEHNVVKNVNGEKVTHKESLFDGDKGLAFSFLLKKGDDFYSIKVSQKGDTYDVVEKKGEDEKKSSIKRW